METKAETTTSLLLITMCMTLRSEKSSTPGIFFRELIPNIIKDMGVVRVLCTTEAMYFFPRKHFMGFTTEAMAQDYMTTGH
jgi:hypothetical protein